MIGIMEGTNEKGSNAYYCFDKSFILVSRKERFKHSLFQKQSQSYAICVTFSYNSYENIDLYSRLRNGVRLKETETIKTRIKV